MITEITSPVTATAVKPESDSAPATRTDRPAPVIEKPVAVEPRPVVRPIEETLQAVAAQIESYLLSVGRSLEFRVDAVSGRTVIAVRDAATGTLIRQIPSEEALRLATHPGAPVLLNTVA